MKTEAATKFKPVVHPGAWKSKDLAEHPALVFELGPQHLQALDEALSPVAGEHAESLTRKCFDLSRIEDDLLVLRQQVLQGLGVAIIRGFPVERYDESDLARLFFGLGTYFGDAVSQSRMGDRLGHVVDASSDPNERGYRSSRELSFLTDSDDIVMMLCVRPAARGGVNRFTSSLTVYNDLVRHAPESLSPLFEGYRYHWRGEAPDGEPPITEYTVPVLSSREDVLSCVFLRFFIEMAADELGEPLSDGQINALDKFEQYASAASNVFEIRLEAGDVFIINNFTVLHSRTACEDDPPPSPGRHLMRLWLKCPGVRPLVEGVRRYYGVDGIQPRAGEGTIYRPRKAS